jgi:hypothetical protein
LQDINIEQDNLEGYGDSNITNLNQGGSSHAPQTTNTGQNAAENASTGRNAEENKSTGHGAEENPTDEVETAGADQYEENLNTILNPEPPTPEEIEMDKMFTNENYPTMQEITEADTPAIGMEFDSREEAFFFFAVYARKMGFSIKKKTVAMSLKRHTRYQDRRSLVTGVVTTRRLTLP